MKNWLKILMVLVMVCAAALVGKIRNAAQTDNTATTKKMAKTIQSALEEYTLDFKVWNDEPLLAEAVQRGNTDEVKWLLAKGADVNAMAKDGAALHMAVLKGDIPLTRLLLSHKADVNSKNGDGFTPLYLAAYFGNIEMAKLLLEHKADVNVKDPMNFTTLHMAVLARSVIAKPPDEDTSIFPRLFFSNWVMLPLTTISENYRVLMADDKIGMVKLLLAHKADVNAKGHNGFTPLHWAVCSGNKELVELLLANKADVHSKGHSGYTALNIAIRLDFKDIVELLLTDSNGINAKDSDGLTSLHEAAISGASNVAKLLLEHKADINSTSNEGFTPLHLAARFGCNDVVKLLLSCKANVNPRDSVGLTPLDDVCRGLRGPDEFREKVSKTTVDLLRSYGAKTAKELRVASGK